MKDPLWLFDETEKFDGKSDKFTGTNVEESYEFEMLTYLWMVEREEKLEQSQWKNY